MGTGSPQVIIKPIPERLADIGMTARDLAQSLMFIMMEYEFWRYL